MFSDKFDIYRMKNNKMIKSSVMPSLVLLQWDLVCSRKGMNKATATAFFVGVMVGSPLFGYLSDR